MQSLCSSSHGLLAVVRCIKSLECIWYIGVLQSHYFLRGSVNRSWYRVMQALAAFKFHFS